MRKVTSQEQYAHLVGLMKTNVEIAKGFSTDAPSEISSFWEKASGQLNSLGPPDRTAKEWRKVWTDYKAFVKKKLTQNKREVNATGGGPYQQIKLSTLEEDVAALVNLNEAITGVTGKSFGTKPRNKESVEIAEIPETVDADRDNIDDREQSANDDTTQEPPRKRSKKACEHPTTMTALIEKQLGIQQSLCDKLNKLDHIAEKNEEMSYNIKRIYRALDKNNEIQNKLLKVQEDQAKENRRHNLQIEDSTREKVKIKNKFLDLELLKMGMESNNS